MNFDALDYAKALKRNGYRDATIRQGLRKVTDLDEADIEDIMESVKTTLSHKQFSEKGREK